MERLLSLGIVDGCGPVTAWKQVLRFTDLSKNVLRTCFLELLSMLMLLISWLLLSFGQVMLITTSSMLLLSILVMLCSAPLC